MGTITAQLSVRDPEERYANPDVVARFDTIRLEQEGPDRVLVSGIRGEPAPPSIKVCMNYMGGYKNSLTFLLTGHGQAKRRRRLPKKAFWGFVGGRGSIRRNLASTLPHGLDGRGRELLQPVLTVGARDEDENGRSAASSGTPPSRWLWPTTPASRLSTPAAALSPSASTGRRWCRLRGLTSRWSSATRGLPSVRHRGRAPSSLSPHPPPPPGEVPSGPTREVALGVVAGARSGDKGGNANVGFWVRSAAAYLWMQDFLTTERIRDLYPEARELRIERYELPNMLSLNFVIHGLLGDGVAASLRPDPQAKMLGEELRAKRVPVPASLLG